MSQPNSAALRSIRRHVLVGVVIVVVLVGGVGGWASTTKLSGAVIAPGQVVVDSNVKKVQHPTGGIVGELRVRDGDRVKAGDIVVRLDDTVTRANLAIVTKGLNELIARKARLESERDGDSSIEFPQELLARASDPTWRACSTASASCSSCGATRASARSSSCSSGSSSCGRKSGAWRRSAPPRRKRSN